MRRATGSAATWAAAFPTSRLRWFTGRFLTAHDLTAEQDYHVGRRRIHHRLLHGWGVVCGFEVRPDGRPGCGDVVTVSPGIALDCQGREVVRSTPDSVRWEATPELTSEQDRVAILCVRYHECLADPLPAITGDCAGAAPDEPGRVVEGAAFELHVPTGDPDDPWSALLHPKAAPADHRCGGPDCVDPNCLEPACDLGDCVPIALLSRGPDGTVRVDVDADGVPRTVRRALPPPAGYLTRVVGTNWTHGADRPVSDLVADGGELRIQFDRPLAEGDDTARGINPFTFVVEVEDSTGNRARVPYDSDHPPRLDDEGRVAVFTIDPDTLRVSRRRDGQPGIVGDAIFVTLYGDLVHDCHGRPVDADFFGSFPSGDGVRGGVFRSWFLVTGAKEGYK
uniref:hypothetical protein n=1 Tax=Paractinoplanes polyasparticus TaxID=2856853 RepID=UPI001C862C20|nr:hypothetical protein [Actinoplanes polyasparticus]